MSNPDMPMAAAKPKPQTQMGASDKRGTPILPAIAIILRIGTPNKGLLSLGKAPYIHQNPLK